MSGNLKIAAQVSDLHLHQYRLKYTQDLPLTSKSQWKSIPTSLEFLSANPTQISETWNSADVFGPTLVRLLVRIQGTASDSTLTSYTIEVESQPKPTT